MNSFETKTKEADSVNPEEISQAIFSAEEFFSEHGQAIEDYAESAGLEFRAGKGWAIEMQSGRATYDPRFFAEKGYTAGEAMWAVCHEVEHFRDWRKDPETYTRLFSRMKSLRRIHLLYNCLDDIMVNRQVDRRFPSHKKAKEGLYREKLFPGTDYSDKPKHIQFAYAMLREKMLPEEILSIDPEVRAEVEKLKNIDGQGSDLISMVSNPTAEPKERYEIIGDYIEPIFEKFYQEDLEKKKQEKKEKGEGGEGEDGEPQAGEFDFSDDYDDFDGKIPRPVPIKDAKDALDKEVKRKRDEAQAEKDAAKNQFEKQHGVSLQEVQRYRQDYEKIKQYIEPLRQIFEKIISERKEFRRRLKERTDQGAVLDPSLLTQAYIDAKAGILDSRTQLKVKKVEFDEKKPNNLEFTVIFDLSSSMNENRPGGKSYEQRMSGVLIMEALAEFEENLKKERLEKSLDLHVFTEARGFASEDEELKPMSDEISYKDRVKINKRLSNCNGGSTKDYESLAKVDATVTPEVSAKIAKGDLKKIIILITDGGSDDTRQAIKEKGSLNQAGVVAKAIQIGKPSAGDRTKFKTVWQNDGSRCPDVSQLVPTIQKLLQDFLNQL
jgi:hypothetical protein